MNTITQVALATGCFVLGGVVALSLFPQGVDVAADRVNEEVTLSAPLTIQNSSGHELIMPMGTVLLHEKDYRGMARLALVVSTEDVAIFRPTNKKGLYHYFAKEDNNARKTDSGHQ